MYKHYIYVTVIENDMCYSQKSQSVPEVFFTNHMLKNMQIVHANRVDDQWTEHFPPLLLLVDWLRIVSRGMEELFTNKGLGEVGLFLIRHLKDIFSCFPDIEMV